MANEVKLKVAIEGARAVSQEIDGVKVSIGQLGTGAITAAKAMAGVFGGFAASQTIGKLVAVQREFDVLNSSLITVTGSSAAAAREMEWIKTFAKETPFGLAQATQGFVKMKALGLDPTKAALNSFGNTASAMGKDLNQMIEAVADASTGEFERLKEFGIKASKQGDQVSLVFQGVTTTVGNSAKEITGYLEAIGNNQFAGAMAERAKTLDGVIAGLGDTWDELFRTVNTNNTGGIIFDSVTVATKAIEDVITVMNAMNGATKTNAKETGAMATVQEAMAVTFETVAVLGANVKYVLIQIGSEIGGLAAQAAQILQGNFAGARAIRESMVSDAAAARTEIDATTARILSARKDATAAAAVNATANARLLRQGVEGEEKAAAATVKSAGAKKAALTDAAKGLALYGDLVDAASGFDKSWAENTNLLRKAMDARLISQTQYNAAIGDLIKKQPLMVEAEKLRMELAKENTKAVDDLFEAQEKLRLTNEDQIKTGRTMLDQIEFETRLLELNADQRALATLERELETKGIVKGTQAYDAYIEKLREAMSIKTGREESIKAADTMREAQKKAAEESGKYWEDALMRAFESGKGFFQSLWDTIKNTLKTQVLKVSIQGIMGSLGLGAAGAAQAGTGLLGSALSSATGGYISSAAGGLTIAGSSISAIGSSVLTGLQAGWSGASVVGAQAAYTAAGASGVAGGLGIGSSIGSALSAIPGWGWAAIGAAAVLGLRSSFVSTQSTGYASRKYGSDGSLLSSATDGNGIGEAGRVLDGIYKSIAGVQASLGATGGASITYNSNTGRESKDPQFYLRTGSYDSGEIQKNDANVSLAISRTILTAIQDSDLPKYLQGAFDGMVAGSMSQEQITAAITGGQALKAFNDELLALPFANLADLSFAATQSLIEFSGGLDQLKGNLASYYENFYTAEEKTAQLTLNTGKAFESLGLTMPALDEGARAAYRSMVELAAGQDMSVDANAKAYAGLLALNPAMNQLAPAIDNAATSVADAIAKMNAAVQSAQNVAVQMGITTAYAVAQSTAQAAYDTAIKAAPALAGFSERQIVAYAADPTKRGELDAKTFDVIDTLVTAIGAWNAAQTTERGSVGASSGASSGAQDSSAADAARAAQQITDTLTSGAQSLAGELLKAQGDLVGAAAAQKAIDTAGYTAAQVAMYDYNQALRDQITALAEAAAKTAAIATERKGLQDQYDTLTMTSAQLLAKQRDALDESNRALFDSINAVKAEADAKADAAKTMADGIAFMTRQEEKLNAILKENAGWMGQLDVLTGKRTQQEVDRANTLASASDNTTRAIIAQVFAQQDLATAAEQATQAAATLKSAFESLESSRLSVANAYKNIEAAAAATAAGVVSAQDGITQGYLSAQDAVASAQEAIANIAKDASVEMQGFADSIKDFLLQMATTDIGSASKADQLAAAQADFAIASAQARAGDKTALGAITGKASTLLSSGQGQFATSVDYARFTAGISNTLSDLATLADGKAGPLAEAIDPMVKAQADLLEAQADLAKWSEAASKSGASTAKTVGDYLKDWRTATAADAIAQADLKAAQLLTQDIDLKTLDVLGELKELIASYNTAKDAVTAAGGVVPSTATSGVVPSTATSGAVSAGAGVDAANALALAAYSTWQGYMADAGADLASASYADIKQAAWSGSGLSGVPAFAGGGSHSGGVRLVGEFGPEIEVTGPSRIYNADQTRRMLQAPSSQQSNEVLVAAIRSLEATVARQQDALDKIAKSSGSTDRILTGVTQGGTSISTKQAA